MIGNKNQFTVERILKVNYVSDNLTYFNPTVEVYLLGKSYGVFFRQKIGLLSDIVTKVPRDSV